MKRVIIVRHAKAVPYGYDDDFNRELFEPRGFDDAKIVSNELRNYGILPDLIISSPAKRALKTAEIYADTFEYPLEQIRREEDLYHGISTHEFVDLLKNIPEEMNNVYIFGHNPTIFYLIKGLAPKFNEEVPTCSSVTIDFKIDSWKSIKSGSGKFAFQLSPRMFK
jgi:phosphohistidine phosphatase